MTAPPADFDGCLAYLVLLVPIGCAPMLSTIRKKSAAGEMTRSGLS